MIVRRIERDDIEAVLALFDAVAEERIYIGTEPGYDRELKRRRFAARVGDDQNPGFVVYDGDALVGHAGVHAHPEYGPTLGMLVAKSHRRHGVGRALMRALDEWAIARRIPALNLFVFPHNESAIAFYLANGYAEIERFERDVVRADGAVWDTILMRKSYA